MSTTWSSPDPLTDDESVVSPPNRRVNTPLRKSAYGRRARDHSPARQTLKADGGDAIREERRRGSVEADKHNHNSGSAHGAQREHLSSSSSNAGRLSPTPYYSTPFRRSAMKVRTTTVPLRGFSDSEGEATAVATPKRGRGRPRKSIGTPVPSKAKRTSTPAAKVPRTKTRRLSDLLGGSSGDNSEEWDFNIPQNVTLRGRSESHGRAPTAIPAEFERASSEVPMSSRANKRGRRIGLDGTPSAFGQSFKKARIGQSRLGRLDFEAEPSRERRSSESIVEPDVGFGPFEDSSRPGTGESGVRDFGSSPPGGGQVAYPKLTPLRRGERRQSVGYQEFSFALHEGEDYGQSSSIGSTGAEPQQRQREPMTKRISPIRSESPEQRFDHETYPFTEIRQPSPLRPDSATLIPDDIPQRDDSPQQQYYDQDSHSDSPTPTPDDQLLRDDTPPQQLYDQDSHSSSPAPSQHHPSSPRSHHSQHSNHSQHSQHSADIPFPSLSPAPQQDHDSSTSLPQFPLQHRTEGEGGDEAFNEFDTIMENEDFTMITAETVPSLLQYFTSPLDPVEQAEIRAEIAAEEVQLEEEARGEEDEAQRRMRESGFMDIVHQTVERSVSQEVEGEVVQEEIDWSLAQSRREALRSPPETQEVAQGHIVEEISFVHRRETRSATREEVEEWSVTQSRRQILRSPPQSQVGVVEEISFVEKRESRSAEREAIQSPTLEDTYEYTLKASRGEEESSLMQSRREIPRSPPPSQVQLVEQISAVHASLSRSASRDINRGNDGLGDDGDVPMNDVEQDWSLTQSRREIPRSPPMTQEVAEHEAEIDEEIEGPLPPSPQAETAIPARLESLHPPDVEGDIVDLSGAFYPPTQKSIVDQEFGILPGSRRRGGYLPQSNSSERSSEGEDDVVAPVIREGARPVLRGPLPAEAFTTRREIPRSPVPGAEIDQMDWSLTQSRREIQRSPIPISVPTFGENGVSMEHMRQESELDDDRDVQEDEAETTIENTLDSTGQEEDLEMEAQPTLQKSSPIKASGRGYNPSPSPPIRVSGRGYVPEPSPLVRRDFEAERDVSQRPGGVEDEQESSEWEEPSPVEEVKAPRSPPIRASGRGYVPSPTPPVQPENKWDELNDQRRESSSGSVEHVLEEDDKDQSGFSDATERNTPVPEASHPVPHQALVEDQDARSDDGNQDISQRSNTSSRSSQPAAEPEIEDVVDAEAQPEPLGPVQHLRSSALLTPDETPSHSNMGGEEDVEVEVEIEEEVDIWALEAETWNQSRVTNHEEEQEDSSATIPQATYESDRRDMVVQQPAETQDKVAQVVQNEDEIDQDVWMAEASTIDAQPENPVQPESAPEPETEPETQASTSTAPALVVEPAPEPPTPGFKRSLQRSQVEIELEEVLQKAQKRRSGLPDEWMRQSRGSFGRSLRGGSLRGGVEDDASTHGSILGFSTDGPADERPSMIGDASLIRREQRHVEAEQRRAEQEREAERIKNLAASKDAERLKRREERELERRKRAEELERELLREREEREAKREEERRKRREERERVRDEEINREREAKFLLKQREEQLMREKEEAKLKADDERKAQEEAQRKADEERKAQDKAQRKAREQQKREAEAQRQAELEAELESERLMVEAKRAAEREAQRVAELRKEREAAKQRRREERQAEWEAELRKVDEDRAARQDGDSRRERDKENVRSGEERAAKRRMLEPKTTRTQASLSSQPEMEQVQRSERFPFSNIPTSAQRLDTKVFIGDMETQSTSYMLSPIKASASNQENDENNPFRMSGQGKRTFEPREARVEKPRSAAAMPKPDFLFEPPTTRGRYTAAERKEEDFEFRPPSMTTLAVSSNSRVRGATLGGFGDVFARPVPVSRAEEKEREPEMEEVGKRRPDMLRSVMKSVETAPPLEDGLYDEDMEKDEAGESEDDDFADAERSVSVSTGRSQSRSVSRSVSRSAEVEETGSGSGSESVASRSSGGSVTPTREEFELTGALYARQRSVSRSASVESSSQASSEKGEDVLADVEMEDAPSQSSSPSPSVTSQSSSSQPPSASGDEDMQSVDERENGDGDEDDDEDPFSRFSDSENEIVSSTPIPPRGILRPRHRQRKASLKMQAQLTSPYRARQRRERPQISDSEDDQNNTNETSSEHEEMEERKHRHHREISENPHSGFRTVGGGKVKSPLKSSFRHPPPPGSPKKAVVFSATTAVSPESSFEGGSESEETVRPRSGRGRRDRLEKESGSEDERREGSVSVSPSASEEEVDAEEEEEEVEEEEETEETEDRAHLRRMTPSDWAKTHWKALLAIKNSYVSSPPPSIPQSVQESPYVGETIWGREEDGSMDMVVEAWMVDVARLFIEAREGEEAGEDWSKELKRVIKRVYGLLSVERRCAMQGKEVPWDVVDGSVFQPVRERKVERLNGVGEWVEVRERRGFFGWGLGWL